MRKSTHEQRKFPPRQQMVVLVRTVAETSGRVKLRPGIVIKACPDGAAFVLPGTTIDEEGFENGRYLVLDVEPGDHPEMNLHERTRFYTSRVQRVDAEDLGREIGLCPADVFFRQVIQSVLEYMDERLGTRESQPFSSLRGRRRQ